LPPLIKILDPPLPKI
jgi:hypothetical protein